MSMGYTPDLAISNTRKSPPSKGLKETPFEVAQIDVRQWLGGWKSNVVAANAGGMPHNVPALLLCCC